MNSEIERWQETEITCPYCGWADTDSWESGMENDGDTQETECGDCDKKFHAQMNVNISYTSKGLCDENGVKHNWKKFDHTSENGKSCKGKHCLTCDEYEWDKKPENAVLTSLSSEGKE